MIEHLLQKGLKPNFEKNFQYIRDPLHFEWTVMGQAIKSKQISVIVLLLKHGYNLNEFTRDAKSSKSVLDIFFVGREDFDDHSDLLKLLLDHGAKLDRLEQETLFHIALWATTKELSLLLDFGFNPNLATVSNVSFINLCIIKANLHNYHKDQEAIKKVKLLINRGATLVNSHSMLHPSLNNHLTEKIAASKSLSAFDESGELSLIKAYQENDFEAFRTILDSGVDVNQVKKGTKWTILHFLFSKIRISNTYSYIENFISFTKSPEILLITLLLSRGALPLKDVHGKTPLMYLNFQPWNTDVINMFVGFEAACYNLDAKEYRDKIYQLSTNGFKPLHISKFWKSFTHSKTINFHNL